MRLIIFATVLVLTGCFSQPKYRVGQVVSNGYCEGVIVLVMDIIEPEYLIEDVDCGNYSISKVWMKESTVVTEETKK